ncbi:hypothetical protein BK011_06625 [Tenericutes bacterium MZ-XQ]|nr:hypothetical protein BK011_06625 [Tenericutes bacterium MZ-XQ]
MSFSQIFGSIAIVMIFSVWMFPLKLLYFNEKIQKDEYKIKRRIGLGLVIALFIVYVVLIITEVPQKYVITSAFLSFFAIISYDIMLNQKAKELLDDKSKINGELLITVSFVPFLLLIVVMIEMVLAYMDPTEIFNLLGMFDFSADKNIAFVMFLRIVGIAYVALITYMYFIYELARDKYNKSNENKIEAANSYLNKHIHWKRIILVLLIGVMFSFFHLAELDFRTTIDEPFHMKFNATRDVFHLIATAIFIPLFFDLIRNKDGGEKK